VTHHSAVETRSLWALALVGLFLGVCCVAICFLHVDRVGVGVVASVLASVVWHSSARQVHWYLDIIVRRAWSCGGIVIWSLLLLLLRSLLVLLRMSSPSSWSELILILSECVVEPSRVGDSLSGSDEFNHLFAFHNVDHFCFVVIVILWEWVPDDLI
jgi:hypothetical protein